MGKKAEAAAIRDKAIDRFLKLRAKTQLILKNSASASDDRESAIALFEKYKAELTFLDSRVFPSVRSDESKMWEENRAREREDILVKVNRYQAIKDDADRRYLDSVNQWNEFGNLINNAKKAVVGLGFMSQEEVR